MEAAQMLRNSSRGNRSNSKWEFKIIWNKKKKTDFRCNDLWAQTFRAWRVLKVKSCKTVVPAGAVPGQIFPSLCVWCHLQTYNGRLLSPGERRPLRLRLHFPPDNQTIARKGCGLCETKSSLILCTCVGRWNLMMQNQRALSNVDGLFEKKIKVGNSRAKICILVDNTSALA